MAQCAIDAAASSHHSQFLGGRAWQLTETLQHQFAADGCSFWQYCASSQALQLLCHGDSGSAVSQLPILQAAHYPTLFKALADGEAIMASAARLHPATSALNGQCLIEYGVHSLLLFPIVEQQLLGCVLLEYSQPTHWQPSQILQGQQRVADFAKQFGQLQTQQQQLLPELLDNLFQRCPTRVAIVEADTLEIVAINQSEQQSNQMAAAAVIGRPASQLAVFKQQPHLAQQLLTQVQQQSHASGEFAMVLNDGVSHQLRLRLEAIPHSSGRYVAVFIDDITKQHLYQQQLEQRLWLCPLTGVYNRARFIEQLSTSHLKQLLLVDIKGFRAFNDTYGERAGDFALQELARRLINVTAPLSGAEVYRIGADEFVLACCNGDCCRELLANSITLFKRLRSEMLFGGDTLHIDVNMAALDLAMLDPQIGPLAALDMAMKVAKSSRTLHQYNAKMQRAFLEEVKLEVELRSAITRKQMQLHYQPLIDVSSGQIVGAEALIRWQHPRLGLVFPGRFIDLAERSNLIDEIGRWVFESALYQLHLWQRRWPQMTMHVNVSVKQLMSDEFFQICWDQLNRYRLQPESLVLEITENSLMEDVVQTGQLCHQLGELGLELAIDDFGTGYSSMSYLKQLPVQKLKIDRSFIADLEFSRESRQIVPAIIAMGKALNLRITAEGVENQYQQQFLRSHMCDEMQGYFYSRAIPAQELEQQLDAQFGQGAASVATSEDPLPAQPSSVATN